MPITSNQLVGQATVVSTTTETIPLATFQLPSETLTGLRIKRIFFSGNVAIGNATANIVTMSGTDHWLLDQSGAALPVVTTLKVTVTGGGTSVVVVDKMGTINANAAANVSFVINP